MFYDSRHLVRYFTRWIALPLAAVVSTTFFAGCADTSSSPQPTGIRARQDKALKDPFSVGGVEQMEQDKTDVSGGGIGDFDKNAFKRDVDSVFSP